jgi:hypothetical protein
MSGTRIGWPIVAIACLMLAASQASAANQLANAGFEDPVTAHAAPFVGSWNAFNGGAGSSSGNSTTTPRNGAQDLRLEIVNSNNNFAGVFQDVPVVAGSPALWSVWHMSPSSPFDIGVEMRIEWRNSVSDTEISRTPNSVIVPTSQYTQFSVQSTVPAGVDTARVVYAVQSFGPEPTNTGLVFVDDAFYDAVPEPASAMLLALGAIGSMVFGRRSRS